MESLVEKPVDMKSASFKQDTFVNAFSSILENSATPFTISIQGEWGSGKTSFMNLVFDNLKDKGYKLIRINTWDYTQFKKDEISNYVMKDFVDKVVNTGDKNKACDLLSLRGLKVAGSMLLSKQIEDKTGVNPADVTENLLSQSDAWNRKMPSNTIKEFREIVEKSIGEDKHIIFIDDLDRINPRDVVGILEAIQIFLSMENCIFILAVDYDIVIKGYQLSMGEQFEKDKSKSFFDKIIQLPFVLPEISEEVAGSYIDDLLCKVYGRKINPEDTKVIRDIFAKSVGSNPRKIKRVINTYWLRQQIFQDNVKDFNLISNLYMTCLQIEFNELYTFINKMANNEETRQELAEIIASINANGIDSILEESKEFPNTLNKHVKMEFAELFIHEDLKSSKFQRVEMILSFFEGMLMSNETFNDVFMKTIMINNTQADEPTKGENLIARAVVNLKGDNDPTLKIKEILEKDERINKEIRSVSNTAKSPSFPLQVFVEFKTYIDKSYQNLVREILIDNKIEYTRVTAHKHYYKNI